jgi:hypothetical protein
MKRLTYHPNSHLYVATLIREVDKGGIGTPLPPTLVDVLDEFANKMPNTFPKVLSPRHTIDHRIDLELGSHPHMKYPYQILG